VFLSREFTHGWSLAPLIIFCLICFIPTEAFVKSWTHKLIDMDINTKQYLDVYFDFVHDYERANPITLRDGFITYVKNLKERGVVTKDEFNRLIDIITNDDAWRYLRSLDSCTNFTVKTKNKQTSLFERILGNVDTNLDIYRIKMKAIKNLQYFLNVNYGKYLKDFEAFIEELEGILEMNKIYLGPRDALRAFKQNIAKSKMMKETLKSEYISIVTGEFMETPKQEAAVTNSFDNFNDNHSLETALKVEEAKTTMIPEQAEQTEAEDMPMGLFGGFSGGGATKKAGNKKLFKPKKKD
jgi:hypothetical protein